MFSDFDSQRSISRSEPTITTHKIQTKRKGKVYRIMGKAIPVWLLVTSALVLSVVVAFAAFTWLTASHVTGSSAAGVNVAWSGAHECEIMAGTAIVSSCTTNANGEVIMGLSNVRPGDIARTRRPVTNNGSTNVWLQALAPPSGTILGVSVSSPQVNVSIPPLDVQTIFVLYTFDSALPEGISLTIDQPLTYRN